RSRNPSTREFRSGGRGHVEIRRDRAAARHDLVNVLCFKIQRPDGAVCLRELAHTHPAPPRSLIRDKAFVKRPRRFIPAHVARHGGGGVPRGIVYEEIDEYIDGLANRGDPALRAVEQQGETEGWPIVAAAEGSLLHVLARSIRARRIRARGTTIGDSGTWLAGALPAAGRRCGPQRCIEGDAGHPDLQRTAVEGPADDRRDRSASGWRLRRAEGSRVGRPSAASAF